MDIMIKNKRSKLINFLKKNNIQTRIFYPPIHKLPPYSTPGKKFPVSSNVSEQGLWLPSSVTIKESQIKFIASKIKEFFR